MSLADIINSEWESLYPGSQPVYGDDLLILRVKNIAEDLRCWRFNAKVLQKQINDYEHTNQAMGSTP